MRLVPLFQAVIAVSLVIPIAACGVCVGDCDRNGSVEVSELVRGVKIALTASSPGDCRAFDANGNDLVDIVELIKGVTHTLHGCHDDSATATPTYAPTASATPIATATPDGLRICGRVQERPDETGYARGVTVVLTPPGTRLSVGTGIDPRFCFEALTPGTYEISVAEQCNPFGCWSPAQVTLTTSSISTFITINPIATPTVSTTPQKPTATRPMVATHTPIATATPNGLRICGRVQERPDETGYARGVTVVLTPPGTRLSVGTGIDPRFCFEALTPGTYEISVAEQCNPFGCWPPVTVNLSAIEQSVFMAIRPLDEDLR